MSEAPLREMTRNLSSLGSYSISVLLHKIKIKDYTINCLVKNSFPQQFRDLPLGHANVIPTKMNRVCLVRAPNTS